MTSMDAERLRDILDAIALITKYALADRMAFDQDEPRRWFYVKQLEIIGEATSRVPAEVLAAAPGIQWHQIITMRHRLVHDYAGVDWHIVWDVLRHDLDPLRQAVQTLLEPS